MKTPREFLLDRHRAAEPNLDAIRQNILPRKAPTGTRFFRELLLPLRWHLAGMSAAWVLAAFLNTDHISPALVAANDSSSTPRPLLVVLAENRRQLVEMIDPAQSEVPRAAQPFVPRRRSESQRASVVV